MVVYLRKDKDPAVFANDKYHEMQDIVIEMQVFGFKFYAKYLLER